MKLRHWELSQAGSGTSPVCSGGLLRGGGGAWGREGRALIPNTLASLPKYAKSYTKRPWTKTWHPGRWELVGWCAGMGRARGHALVGHPADLHLPSSKAQRVSVPQSLLTVPSSLTAGPILHWLPAHHLRCLGAVGRVTPSSGRPGGEG